MDTNPYAPVYVGEVVLPKRRLRSWAALVTLLICTLAYHAFILMLIMSGASMDRYAGYLFLVNSPLILVWLVMLYRRVNTLPIGSAVMALQVLFGAIIVFMGASLEPAVVITGIILLAWATVFVLAYFARQ